jgi:alanyl-tRNA synthetase
MPKLISFLYPVFKLRTQNSQLRHDFDLLKENNQRLMDANASAGASFAALNQHAKQLHKQNNKLTTELSQYRVLLQKASLQQMELREEIKMKQSTYVAEVHSRLQYQKTMSRIVDKIQQKSRDSRLIEDILQMVDDCEEMFLQGPVASPGAANNNASPTKLKSSSSSLLVATTVATGTATAGGIMVTSPAKANGTVDTSNSSDSIVSRFKSLFG